VPFGPEQVGIAARHAEPLSGWFPLAFVAIWALATWVLASTVLGFVSGHAALLSRYPPADEPVAERFSFASGTMRVIPYGSALYVAIGARGLHVAPNWLFRPLTHRGIPCIPWADLRCTQAQTERGGWIPRYSRFEVAPIGLRFELYGRPGRSVESALAHARGAANV